MIAFRDQEYNQILDGDGFYVSYNPCPLNGPLAPFTDLCGQITGLSNAEPETALYNEVDRKWRILIGDFRKAYMDAISGGWEACLALYEANIGHRSPWSTDDTEGRCKKAAS